MGKRAKSGAILLASFAWLSTSLAHSQALNAEADTRQSAQILFTGHSLIDNPLPDWVELIARSQNKVIAWEQQIVIGSPLRVRTWGNENEGNWAGYAYGKNRSGERMNIADELRDARRIRTGKPYDTLVVAENHNLIGMIIWENAIGYLRHYHDRLLEGNPASHTFYVHTWLGIDKDSPSDWIDHETHASDVWQCVAEKVRLSLKAEKRPATISMIPAGTALVELVQRTLKGDVAGITGSARERLNKIFRDDVHLTDIGIYYVAAVHYATIYGKSPVGAKAPATISAELAAELQKISWAVVQDFQKRERARSITMDECRGILVEKVCSSYWKLAGETKEARRCADYFAETRPGRNGNPFIWPDPNWKVLPAP